MTKKNKKEITCGVLPNDQKYDEKDAIRAFFADGHAQAYLNRGVRYRLKRVSFTKK